MTQQNSVKPSMIQVVERNFPGEFPIDSFKEMAVYIAVLRSQMSWWEITRVISSSCGVTVTTRANLDKYLDRMAEMFEDLDELAPLLGLKIRLTGEFGRLSAVPVQEATGE